MFERISNTPTERNGKKHEKYGDAISVLSEDVEEYKFEHMEAGQSGTRVPKSTRTGGILGSKNAHGAVMMGDKITIKKDVGFVSLGELEPVVGLVEEAIKAEVVEPEPVVEDEEEEEEWEEDRAQMAAELEELSKYEPPSITIQEKTASAIRDAHAASDAAPVTTPKKRVKMSGSFGTYRGKYTHIQETDDLIVLLYDMEDPVYSPPASTEPFNISCGKHSHKVYFAGVEFELDFLKQGVQVFVKKTE